MKEIKRDVSQSDLRLFDALWSQVWILQLLKEWNIRTSKPPTSFVEHSVVLALTLSIFICLWRSMLCKNHTKALPRVALACSGICYLALRGSSSNHVVLQCLVCLAVLEGAVTRDCLRQSSRRLLGILYFITAIAKCNYGWLQREYSCAVLYTVAAGTVLKIKNIPMLEILPYLAIFGEVLLALLFWFWHLISSKWKIILVIIGAIFHCGLALPMPPLSVYPFSALMAPLFALADDRGTEEGDLAALIFGIFCFPLSLAIAMRLVEEEQNLLEYPPYASWRHGLAWCLAAFASVVYRALMRVNKGESNKSKSSLRLTAVLLIIIGALPYFGVRTHPTFLMFSNLRIEGASSNHWFFSTQFLHRISLSPALSDVVTVTKAVHLPTVSSMRVDLGQFIRDPALSAANISTEFIISPPSAHWFAANHSLQRSFSTPRLELRRRMSNINKEQTNYFLLEYIDHSLPPDSPRQRVERFQNGTLVADDPSLLKPLHPFVAAIFRFRVFDFDRSPCRH